MERATEKFVPIYQRLYLQYREAIIEQRYEPGSRIDSINEMMKRHQISRETAKIVLKKLADEQLIVQKAGKGSFVADLGPRNAIWGILVPFFSAFTEKLISLLIVEAKHVGREIKHYVYYNNWEEEINLVGSLINQRYEAIIVVPTFDESKTAQFYNNLVSGGTVVTLLDHTMAGSYFTYAIQSYDLGVKRAVQYLLDQTKGTLAFVKNDVWIGRNMVQEFMQETFRKFVEMTHPHRKAVVVDHLSSLSDDFIQRERIGGIFCCDDTDAVRLIGKLKESGFHIPGDLSLISYGNTDLARYFTPKITSIDCHCEEMASITSTIIQDHLDGKDIRFAQYVVQPDLVVRET
jgi:DNA-binding LacI/PurR family transcriptional regulator